jgi:2,5-dioxopentanoate dehydrogenase
MFRDASMDEINAAVMESNQAFQQFRKYSLKQKADLMRAIARELENCGDELIATAMQETNLPEARLRNERARTMFQLNSYGEACEKGEWLDARIDTADPEKTPPKPDLRKTMIPLGPVVVFGSSNFPFAYSTAGGDTACALAAGCTVIVKAHPAHPQTSERVALAVQAALSVCKMPAAIFRHIHGSSFEIGKTLVMHPLVKAVGFTGSFTGGKQLFDWANRRKEPIPVFAEMGSVNPVFLLEEKLKTSYTDMAKQYAASITLGVGQFCTNPGLIFGIKSPALDNFQSILVKEIENIAPAKMLHPGIAKAYHEKRANALGQKNVERIGSASAKADELSGDASIAKTNAKTFIANPLLHQEVFGPYSLLIECDDASEMLEAARHLEGQLTATIMGTDHDLISHTELVDVVSRICGRFILNGVPTGVEVCRSMMHGGPFPATTDSRFTAVGADGIRRFARPIAYQNWPDHLLPHELKNANPLGIWRMLNNELTKDRIN